VIKAVIEKVPDAIRVRRQARSEQHIYALADICMANDPPSAALQDIERGNAESRARFVNRWPLLTAELVASRVVHGSTNRIATPNHLKAAGKIFAIRVGGREVYLAFQFRDGYPHPSIAAKILETFLV